jgi:recombination protein RecA
VRIDIRRKDTLKDAAGNAIGNHVKVKIVKNKVAPPFCEAEFDIIYNHGIDKEGSILDMGIDNGAVDKKGAWLQFDGDLIGQGREAARKSLMEKPELAKKIIDAIFWTVPTDRGITSAWTRCLPMVVGPDLGILAGNGPPNPSSSWPVCSWL